MSDFFKDTNAPIKDTISRQAALMGYQGVCEGISCDECPFSIKEGTFTDCRLERFILNLPSAQQWIPCSERLPSDEDYDETFTVTIQCEHHDGWDDYVTGCADWTPRGWDIQSYYIGQIKVVAWMPFPKPYKEEGNG